MFVLFLQENEKLSRIYKQERDKKDEFKDILEEKELKDYIKKYKYFILIGVVIIILIITTVVCIKTNKTQTKKENVVLTKTSKKEISKKEENKKKIKVDIKGEVLNPTVYELEEKSRVIDVINKAGGLKEDADTSYINLSKKLKDEMVIIIYSKNEIKEYKEKKNSPKYIYIEKDCECPDEMNEACITQKSKSKTTKNTTESEDKEENDLISINSANIDELQKINGIGKSKAESIIKYREENGDFKKIDDIKNVTGIGDSLFEKIKDQITVQLLLIDCFNFDTIQL